jgi:hypothetical protein
VPQLRIFIALAPAITGAAFEKNRFSGTFVAQKNFAPA